MKTWTMPQVMVEGFASNEYVAACEQVDFITGKRYHLDLGPRNDNYDSGENVTAFDGAFDLNFAHEAAPGTGWHYNVNIWKVNPDTGMINAQSGWRGKPYATYKYNGVNAWVPQGSYSVYIVNPDRAYIYKHGSEPGGGVTPTEDKAFS